MKTIQNLVYSVLFSSITLVGYTQKATLASADKEYNQYAYIDAIATYERIADKGYMDQDMFRKLGNSYYFNAELPKAEKWYRQLFSMSQEQEPEYFYRYSQCLKSVGDYATADKMMETFNQKSGSELRAKHYSSNKNYLEEIKANSGRYTIGKTNVNSRFSDYGGAVLNNKLVFASARDTGGVAKRISKWDNQSFTNFYEAEIGADGQLGTPVHFSKRINSKFHEASAVFTSDGKTMYFTRNNFLDGKRRTDKEKKTLLKIYSSTFDKDQWGNVKELPFNSNEYSVAHPALSPDGKTLYFVSDMPGTLGQSDLFSVAINGDGTYGKPVNLGKGINTEGRETFPFVSQDNELYYASDGRPGLGGLDVFVAQIEKDGSISESQNVGEPINGKTDDFGFIIDNTSRAGFFSTNREGGVGYDDIYSLKETKKLKCEQELEGIVTNTEDGEPLAKAKVTLFDSKFNEIKSVTADDNGHYSFKELNCGETYHIRATKDEYTTKEQKITLPGESGKTTLSLSLEKALCKVAVGDDLGKCFGIKMIYFDLDKAFIKKEFDFDLEKILDVLKQYPNMKIDVRSHTDSRQSDEYNMVLSEKRVKATMDWLIKKGVAPSRLTGKGYGETQLVNGCSDGVSCTEEQHQANRRSEFIITKL